MSYRLPNTMPSDTFYPIYSYTPHSELLCKVQFLGLNNQYKCQTTLILIGQGLKITPSSELLCKVQFLGLNKQYKC